MRAAVGAGCLDSCTLRPYACQSHTLGRDLTPLWLPCASCFAHATHEHRYSSGAPSVQTLYTSAGLSYWFYEDGARARRGPGGRVRRVRGGGKPPCGPVLCAFNPAGTGFANFTSGKPRLGAACTRVCVACRCAVCARACVCASVWVLQLRTGLGAGLLCLAGFYAQSVTAHGVSTPSTRPHVACWLLAAAATLTQLCPLHCPAAPLPQ